VIIKRLYIPRRQLFVGPKVLAFQLLALEVARRAREPVDFVVYEPSKGWGALDEIFEKTKLQARDRNLADGLRSLTPGSVRMFPAIQTADLLAYESYREISERAEKFLTGKRRKVTKSMDALHLAGRSLARIVEEELIAVGIVDHQEPVAPRTLFDPNTLGLEFRAQRVQRGDRGLACLRLDAQ
jgi:hypothetical protein